MTPHQIVTAIESRAACRRIRKYDWADGLRELLRSAGVTTRDRTDGTSEYRASRHIVDEVNRAVMEENNEN